MQRVSIWLDDAAYSIYQEQPYHERSQWVNALIKASAGQQPPRRRANMAATVGEDAHRLVDRLVELATED